jgi:PAS domain S-box-containing protein
MGMASPRILSLDWSNSQDQSHSAYRYAFRFVLVFLLYFGAGKLGLAVPFTNSNVSPVWPAAGIAVAAVLMWGSQIAPAIALAAFVVNFSSPIPAFAAVGIGLGNALSAVVAGYLLRRLDGFEISLPRLKDVLRFAVLAAMVATTIAATVGVMALTLTSTKAWSGYSSAWRVWWLGDAMGVLVVAPLFLAGRELLKRCSGWRALELCFLFGSVLATSAVIYGPWAVMRDDVLAFVVFPFVTWAAIRFRVAGAASTTLLAAAAAIWGTAHRFGPFLNHTPLHNAMLLQVFIAVTSLTGLILAAVMNERDYIRKALESSAKVLGEIAAANERLEQRAMERTHELEQKTAQLASQARLLDQVNDAILVRGADGAITYWNEGAERLYGWTKQEALGKSTQELIQTEFPIEITEILGQDRWEGELRQRRRDGSQITVASRWATLRDNSGNPVRWLEINTDVTVRKQVEDAARRLSGRILTLQDDERRRIARGLHDSLGQYLTALKMNLDLLSKTGANPSEVASECANIVDNCLSETRTISHLLHPPLLDEAGFASAARWYVDGFAQRSGITVNLDLAPELGRLHKDVELALFRAVQEALTNVHRHSESSAVDIRLMVDGKQVRLEIKDNGKGIPPNQLKHLREDSAESGVGIAGMRERMRELGGSLQIQSGRSGTTVVIRVPLVEKENANIGGMSSAA